MKFVLSDDLSRRHVAHLNLTEANFRKVVYPLVLKYFMRTKQILIGYFHSYRVKTIAGQIQSSGGW